MSLFEAFQGIGRMGESFHYLREGVFPCRNKNDECSYGREMMITEGQGVGCLERK